MTARVVCLTTCVTRVTHSSGSVGNESLVAREPVTTPDGRRTVPWVSGNSLRHSTVRGPGAAWLVDRCGLGGGLTLAQLNFLFHGGSLTESTGREPTARVAEMRAAAPLLALLGGCLPDQIIPSALRVGPGVLCCEENRDRLAVMLGAGILDGLPPLAPAESFVESFQYATYDVRGKDPARAEAAPDFASSASDPRMLYVGQCVRAGAVFAHEYFVTDPTPENVGALLWSLHLWRAAGGFVGGMVGKGHGRTDTVAAVEGSPADPAACVRAYLAHAESAAGRAAEWLRAAFARPEKKPGRGRAKKTPEPAGAEPE